MAKIKFVIVDRKKGNQQDENEKYVVHTYLSAHYKNLRVPTNISVKKEHWDKENERVYEGKGPKFDSQASSKNVLLGIIKSNAKEKMLKFPEKVEAMDVYQLRDYLIKGEEKTAEPVALLPDFLKYADQRIIYYQAHGMTKSEETMICSIQKLREFCGRNVLPFDEIDDKFLQRFQHWCLTTPVKPTTKKKKYKKKDPEKIRFMTQGGVSVYMRYVRAVFNDALADDLPIRYPFKKFKIKKVITKHRNLPIETIRLIRDYTPANQREEVTRDLFMLQIYLCGINVADLWIFDKTIYSDGRIRFYRKKTERHQRYQSIKVEPEARALLEKYKGKNHLLWFADNQERSPGEKIKTAEMKYKDEPSFLKMVDNTLAKIQKALGVHENIKITDYYVRHSLATILRTKVLVNGKTKVTMSDVACILGHKEVEHKVTGTYIDEDYEGNDVIMRAFIDLLNEKAQKPTKGKLLTLAEMGGSALLYN